MDCGNPGEIANGRVDVSNGTKLGARANYECDTGYTLNGKEYRVCGFDGDWKGRIPACAGKKAGGLSTHTTLTMQTPLRLQYRVLYVCVSFLESLHVCMKI